MDDLTEREAVMMPIGKRVSFANEKFPMGAAFEKAAERNHYQSLKRLAERGGLSWCEAAAVVEFRPWFKMDDEAAEAIVRKALRGDHLNDTPSMAGGA